MCGIAGFWQTSVSTNEELIKTSTLMANTIAHRGPDGGGAWAHSPSGIALSHRRLSIVDVSAAGHQPMTSAQGRYVLVFNGEIYNHLELRKEVELAVGRGGWRGYSDTETLLAGIEAWGIVATLQKLVGMFAIAIWDKRESALTLARDRLGEKPLYYGWVNGKFAFGSELKALRAMPKFGNEIDREALSLYMQYGNVPAPLSIYANIFKLLPGTLLAVTDANLVTLNLPDPMPYWSFEAVAAAGMTNPYASEDEALNSLETVLSKAVADQMVADVPLGAFLSGGVDSSTIVALMQAQSETQVKTFTVGFDEAGFDETPHAAAVAKHLGTDHHEVRVSAVDAQNVVSELPEIYDEPFADSSQIPTFLLSRVAKSSVTVALSGDAGDELFGGYSRYIWGPKIWDTMRWVPFPIRSALGKSISAVPPPIFDALGKLLPVANQISIKTQKVGDALQIVRREDDLYFSLISQWKSNSNIVLNAGCNANFSDILRVKDGGGTSHQERMMQLDTTVYLPNDILTKVDRAAMRTSLETRIPFLDHRVVEVAWRLPLSMKIRGNQTKWALRQILYKHVPIELIERPKAGFAVPIGEWLRGPLREWAENLLDKNRIDREGYLNSKVVHRAWLDHLNKRTDNTAKIWTVLMFQAWLDRNGKQLKPCVSVAE